MAAVKGLVAFMSLLLLLGLGLLGYGMVQKSDEMRQPEGSGLAAFGPAGLDEPAGTRITHMVSDGRGRVLLGLTGGGRPDRVAVIDAADGRRLGTLTVGGAGAAPQ
ncbi:hypothetical protein [Roseospira goensis]|uniref:Uncharacterized protein n=1 Tax=Roseospira goensis TaxID=391922 RepID=A0A7W6WJQ1_9PROT|nr:hypothetical protein [Roseospira goensis]MBB4285255.1 hypothetical protein [Roseospira goensis]